MDTSTTYLGLRLKHPFIAGASPMSASLDTIKRLEDAGCAAIVMHSLFEEQITQTETGTIRHRDPLDPEFATALSYFPASAEYLEHVHKVKNTVGVPVIGSLNGTTSESWLKYAREIQDTGADALEVNMYEVVTDLDVPGLAVERTLCDLVTELKRTLRIPVAVKLSPFFSAVGNLARQLDAIGADGLVLFNRFYQPDIDIKTIAAVPVLHLSRNSELLLRLRWLALLHGRLRASLALTGGVETSTDAIKGLLAGAHVVQIVSAALRHGPAFFATVRDGLTQWMEWQHIASVQDMRGRVSAASLVDASAFERAQYIRTLQSWGK
jgi:dihydroorotate dehydrogenase (fumarate)